MIRVLVVDDSALVRKLITTALEEADDIEVVATARDGLDAVSKIDEIDPDIVTLDIEMPNLDGLGALKIIKERHPRTPVIMFSTLTERGAHATLEALSLGASDYVTKPSNTGSVREGLESVREQILPRIRALAGMRRLAPAVTAPRPRPVQPPVAPVAKPAAQRPQILVVGCSTGGPDALAKFLPQLPADFPLPVLIVQHMPPVFTTMLAQRLDKIGPLTVREAVEGDKPAAGTVLIAPGDWHMRLKNVGGSPYVALDQGPQENFCRPAVDPLFRSAAEVYGGHAIAVVLTGMGQDGLHGVEALTPKGVPVLVQDEATSVVWGMPGAVAGHGLADVVAPIPELAAKVVRLARGQ